MPQAAASVTAATGCGGVLLSGALSASLSTGGATRCLGRGASSRSSVELSPFASLSALIAVSSLATLSACSLLCLNHG